jgi:hypothetical protein
VADAGEVGGYTVDTVCIHASEVGGNETMSYHCCILLGDIVGLKDVFDVGIGIIVGDQNFGGGFQVSHAGVCVCRIPRCR